MSEAVPSSSDRPRRGRPALRRSEPLERGEIIDRSLDIVRAEGLEALSMRRLANDLSVSPMAIYHHVADKPALIDAMLVKVWSEVLNRTPRRPPDPIEAIVATCVATREVWLEHFDLATLAVGVVEPDDALLGMSRFQAELFAAAGFPDVPLAYSAIQNFTMGVVEVAANRRSASAYFGRDPRTVLAAAKRLFARRKATEDERGILEARFDPGDDRHFEPALRALIAGLLAG